jgi:thymidine kinase
MAKLYFRHGPMGSAKTLNLLAVAHNYRAQGKHVIVTKPALDQRSNDLVASRCGLNVKADLLLDESSIEIVLTSMIRAQKTACILVDEAQFLSASQVSGLRWIVDSFNIPVICYGLRTDFLRRAFPGSARLFELADSIEEIKTTCHVCGRKAIFNARLLDGVYTFDESAPQVHIGFEYRPLCSLHYSTEAGLWQTPMFALNAKTSNALFE